MHNLQYYFFTDAIASSENIRLAPSMRSQKGAVWTKQTVNFQWWEVDIMFRVSGRGRIGADGLVIMLLIYIQSKHVTTTDDILTLKKYSLIV